MTNSSSSSFYNKIFSPGDVTVVQEDGRPDAVYCWNKDIVLAVNVALATGRALLLQGEPGVGKSAVAAAVAQERNWRYYPYSVSSRTEAQDLTWKMDHVRRLAGAHDQALKDDLDYLVPGPFWWGFDRASAARRGKVGGAATLNDPSPTTRGKERSLVGAVVLIDEIDKADPAVANDLLETVGAQRFRVDGVAQPFDVEYNLAQPAEQGGLLMVFTSNDERDMPEAFLRRCIVQTIAWPADLESADTVGFNNELRKIARANWARLGSGAPADADSPEAEALLNGLISMIWVQRLAHKQREKRPPGLAEFLDAVAACRELDVRPGSALWDELKRLVWSKDSVSL